MEWRGTGRKASISDPSSSADERTEVVGRRRAVRRCLLRIGATCKDESGQVMVEFALILLPFLLLVGGIIYFGIGLNYWLDTQRLANQGARWAVVNEYPGCARTESAALSCGKPTSLQMYIACGAVADGL